MKNNSIRNLIFLGMILVVLGSFTLATSLGNKQDEIFAAEQQIYDTAVTLYTEGKYEEAYIYTKELVKFKPNSYLIHYFHANTAYEAKDFATAKIHMEKSMDLNPYQIEDPQFMLDLGLTLKEAGYTKEALIVFKRCKVLEYENEPIENYQNIIDHLISELTI